LTVLAIVGMTQGGGGVGTGYIADCGFTIWYLTFLIAMKSKDDWHLSMFNEKCLM
jgi:hypothetical protein